MTSYGEQAPALQTAPEVVQFWHVAPPVPHSASVVPVWQTSLSQHPAQSVAPHCVSVRQAPSTQDCPFSHCAHSAPPVPHDEGSVPVLQIPPTQHPWQFWGLHVTLQIGDPEVSWLHA